MRYFHIITMPKGTGHKEITKQLSLTNNNVTNNKIIDAVQAFSTNKMHKDNIYSLKEINTYIVYITKKQRKSFQYAYPKANIVSDCEITIKDTPYNSFPESTSIDYTPSNDSNYHVALPKANETWHRTTGQGVKIAIIDTGIADDHPYLTVKGGISLIPGEPQWQDTNGHGTHCAGIASGKRNIDEQTSGLAPDADLYAVRVFSSSNKGNLCWLLAGLCWCYRNSMDVVSISLTLTTQSEKQIARYTPPLERICKLLYTNNTIITAAAGNTGAKTGEESVKLPARCKSVIAVAAVGKTKSRVSLSSYGPRNLSRKQAVEIAAPGEGVYSTKLKGKYRKKTGTSMATPSVAAAAALLKQQHPTWSAKKIRQQLFNSTEKLNNTTYSQKLGSGLLNCYDAVFKKY